MSDDDDSLLRRLIAAMEGSSRAIPSDQDFFFYLNFDEFRQPILRISSASLSALSAAAALPFPPDLDLDLDDAFDRLVDANDAHLERFDAVLDEFRSNPDGFQLVIAKKKKKNKKNSSASASAFAAAFNSAAAPETEVRMAMVEAAAMGPKKPKVPFHIPTIPKPQLRYNIVVNNVNQPFEHVWLQQSGDSERRFIHPLEKVSVSDFVDEDVTRMVPAKPPPVESTSFKLVEETQDLKELTAKLRAVDEFAVDLEHNQYRSFQGLTCLIQISTRTEDFVIDAFKLRVQIGPYLREVFKDPTKRKVMHGAERDIIWLQRDFGIYVCNMFDTGQASRVLKLERHSLEYLLDHFCGVTANKEYQNADWRLRPVPPEMLRYAREDTHYLLHIYDLMRIELFKMSKESENPKASLLEVYQRSCDVCMQLYEKELLTPESYLYVYGLQGAGLNAQQLAVVAGLFEWRDVMARTEDESTGYILPNKALLEMAKQMPDTTSKLLGLIKSKHPHVEHHLDSVVSIIKNSMTNAAAFEAAVETLKDAARVRRGYQEYTDEPEVGKVADASPESMSASPSGGSSTRRSESNSEKIDSFISLALNGKTTVSDTTTSFSRAVKVTEATVQVQKKPNRAFSALLGNSVSKKRLDSSKQDKQEEAKLEQIKASAQFRLPAFSGPAIDLSNASVSTPVKVHISDKHAAASSPADSKLDAIIRLNDDSDVEESRNGDLGTAENGKDPDQPMSLSDLSSSFEQCFDKDHRRKKLSQAEKPLPAELFDYEAKKKAVFGEKSKENEIEVERKHGDSKGKKKTERAVKGDDDEAAEFAQGRRRKAFPASGNRSFTFR